MKYVRPYIIVVIVLADILLDGSVENANDLLSFQIYH